MSSGAAGTGLAEIVKGSRGAFRHPAAGRKADHRLVIVAYRHRSAALARGYGIARARAEGDTHRAIGFIGCIVQRRHGEVGAGRPCGQCHRPVTRAGRVQILAGLGDGVGDREVGPWRRVGREGEGGLAALIHGGARREAEFGGDRRAGRGRLHLRRCRLFLRCRRQALERRRHRHPAPKAAVRLRLRLGDGHRVVAVGVALPEGGEHPAPALDMAR